MLRTTAADGFSLLRRREAEVDDAHRRSRRRAVDFNGRSAHDAFVLGQEQVHRGDWLAQFPCCLPWLLKSPGIPQVAGVVSNTSVAGYFAPTFSRVVAASIAKACHKVRIKFGLSVMRLFPAASQGWPRTSASFFVLRQHSKWQGCAARSSGWRTICFI